MMANDWKTPEEICQDYHITMATFYNRRDECLSNPDYRDAVIRDGGKRTYIDENLWQKFLRYRSEQYRIRQLDPHLREVK